MATFNGAKYLQEFLDSLAAQRDVTINLLVSDDGSRDETLNIIEANRSRFSSVQVMQGPQQGPAQNFFHLLRQAKADYVAFADQDDIWGEDHLALSIERLRINEGVPALSFSSSMQIFETGQPSSVWPLFKQGPQLSQMYIECWARGCTVALNKLAVDLVNRYPPKEAVMHDWWCLLVMQTCGIVIYEPKPEINYRIHGANTIGLGNRSFINTLRTIRHRRWRPYVQIVELYQSYEGIMKPTSREEVKKFIDALEGSLLRRAGTLVSSRSRFRESAYNEFRTRMAFLFFPWIFKVDKNSTEL